MWIKIIPNDTLFFRSGRPFSMGSDTWTDIIFPPYPSTIYGSLRTFLLFERGTLKEFREKYYSDIGNIIKKGNMKIIGPLIFDLKQEKTFFPIPLDLVSIKSNNSQEKNTLLLTKIKKPEIFYSDIRTEEILIYTGKEKAKDRDEYLDNITLKKYLENKEKVSYSYLEKDTFLTVETKIGIARDRKTLTAKEEHLYRIPMIRMKKEYGFLIKIDEVENIPDSGTFQLGGEGKTANYYKINNNPIEDLEKTSFTLNNGLFKIYFATPAIFKKGWIPEWINENTMEGEKDGIKLKLVTCVIGKFIRVGGWDIGKKEPKTMYKAVPAGSVYYFKVINNTSLEEIKKTFHFQNISDINPEEGFGLSLIGVVS